ncbi:MAG: uroporphyrinogen-III C-methyltransferase [Proteobacteria bacterium]|nr:uroporphyrinogen-III C-methyltransferase [Pseudomonadota bacterium]MBI3499689.1 uroporphyrinogen-III C-methyltransferase [Pseudomonadota bacterium]
MSDFALPEFAEGSVWLVGAGPGDPGLLSVLAWHALTLADVVVHDALVDERILRLARPGAVIEYAGKRGGKPSPTQPAISKRLIQLARERQRVLRLKGGDPFVFGRGGEEALALVAAGIPFRIVPGITAGIGGLAYAGIPVTHRDTNEAVTFITGHNTSGEVPDRIDWQALAKGSPVIVLYMALKHLGIIRERLLASGRHADEPLAIVSEAATPRQRVLETTLGASLEAAAAAKLEPPAIIVLGEVVRLRSGLDWLGLSEGRALDPDPLGLGRNRDAG